MLGLSTSWRSEVANSGIEVIGAILDLGVGAVELEYRLTPAMWKEILSVVKRERITVLSLHNFVPLPEWIPREKANGENVSLSSPDQEERGMALKYTRRTMEWAEELGARAVVLHMGKVPMDSPMEKIKKWYDEKKIETAEGREFIAGEKKKRAEKGADHLGPALRSLEKLAGEAERRGVLLGVESRYNIQDFPSQEEFKALFQEFPGSPVRYWHDIGHATTQQNLGLANQEEMLKDFGGFLVGVHLHGCKGYEDHDAPGSGQEDYDLLKKFLQPETIRVVETHHRATQDELRRGLEFLRQREIF